MIRSIPLMQLTPLTREFVTRWRVKKNYTYSPEIDITDCLEILFATNAFHQDTSLEGALTFDFTLDLKEIKIGYDGEQLLDILVYYLEAYVKERISKISTMV